MAMKILIADADLDFCTIFRDYLNRLMPTVRVEFVGNGQEMVDYVARFLPDVVVVNLLLPGRDGLGAMQAIRAMKLLKQPELVVISSYHTVPLQEALWRLNIAFFTPLPCDLRVLAEAVRNRCRELIWHPNSFGDTLEERITTLQRELGLAMRCKGFAYARYGLQLLETRQWGEWSTTKHLYPAIAVYFKTTATNVERDIRSAILKAWKRDGYLRQRELFLHRPTNSEYFAVLSDFLRQEQKKRETK